MQSNLAHDLCGVPASSQERLGGVLAARGSESWNEDGGEAKLDVQAPTRTSDHLASEDAGIPQASIPQAGIPQAGIPQAGITGSTPPDSHSSIPLNIPELPDFMQDYLRIAATYSDALPGALLTAWLPFISVNIGNRVYIPFGAKKVYPNIWAVITGPSTTSRKSSSIRVAKKTMLPYEASLDAMKAEDKDKNALILGTVTLAKLGDYLQSNPSRLLTFDELGELLQGFKRKHNAGMKENLTKAYDADSYMYSTKTSVQYIKDTALSILGASTEGWIYNDFQSGAEKKSGFLQRTISCVIGRCEHTICTKYSDDELDFHDLQAYEEYYRVFRAIPRQYKLRLSKEARNYWLKMHDATLNFIKDNKDNDCLAYATRIFDDYWFKFCVIISLFENFAGLKDAVENDTCDAFFATLKVSVQTARQALYLCDYYYQNSQPFQDIIEIGEKWQDEKKVVEYLCKRPGLQASRSDVINGTHIQATKLNVIIYNLREQEALTVKVIKNPGTKRKTSFYKLTSKATEIFKLSL